MCGFAGFLSLGSNPSGSNPFGSRERRRILEDMGRIIAHRGPDDQQIYDDGTLSLVFRRLSIVDTEGGRQPLFNESRDKLLICNGEIYNHHALRHQLSDTSGGRHRFATGSDCETILHGHEEWGDAVLQRLAGMFALLVWDIPGKRLLLARDRLGIKPLYLCQLPDGLLFGSELKALLAHPQCPRDMDWAALERPYFGVTRTDSYIQGVEFLMGGEYLVLQAGTPPRRDSYWRIEDHFATAPYGNDAARYVQAYDELLDTVTIEHLQGDWPAVLHLSGGIDSSLLAAIVARHKTAIPCFSVVERTTHLAGDVASARQVTRDLQLPWHPVLFDYRHLLDELAFSLTRLEEYVWMMDSPIFSLEWVMKEALTRAAHAACPTTKVVLIGQGADEFAGGYSARLDAGHADWQAYLRDEVVPHVTRQLGEAPPADGRDIGPFHRFMTLMVRQLQYHNLWHEDRTSSLNSIEARVPFLDHRLVELLASIPAALHETLFWDKRIVRDALYRRLPGYDRDRPKIGFTSTRDIRSTDMLWHEMACRLIPAFRDKYMAAADFPLDRAEFDTLMRRVLERAPGFDLDSYRLINRMTAVIFARICRLGEEHAGGRYRPSSLAVVQPHEWAQVEATFQAPPLSHYPWQGDDLVTPPPGTRLHAPDDETEAAGHGEGHGELRQYELRHADSGEHVLTLNLPAQPWITRFMRGLGEGEQREVAQWSALLGVSPETLGQLLDILLTQGCVSQPDVARILTPLRLAPAEAPAAAASGSWLRRLFAGA